MTDEQNKTQMQDIDPTDYFKNIKEKKQVTTDEFLQKLCTNMEAMLKKAHALGQKKVVTKLLYAFEVLEKERELYKLGFREFVYRDDVEYYMDKVSDKAVKILTLAEYPREIPNEIAERMMPLVDKNIFDVYYVVFTDYTGKIEREVQAERKRKDPILFGAFRKDEGNNRMLHDRFYYIADWEDEYCDLTFDKMISEMSKVGKDIVQPVCIPDADVQTIRDYMNAIEEDSKKKMAMRFNKNAKKSFFKSIKFWEK